jgi:hypothetical protein
MLAIVAVWDCLLIWLFAFFGVIRGLLFIVQPEWEKQRSLDRHARYREYWSARPHGIWGRWVERYWERSLKPIKQTRTLWQIRLYGLRLIAAALFMAGLALFVWWNFAQG